MPNKLKDIGMKALTNPLVSPLGYGIKKLDQSMKKDEIQKTKQKASIPSAGRGATNLFSDEQEKYDMMIGDGLDDTMARSLITKKRKKMLASTTKDEANTLTKMREDGLDSETAVKVLKDIRYRNLPLWKKALKIPFDASVGATSLATEQVGSALDFATAGQVPYFKEQVQGVKDVTSRSFEGQPGFQAGRNIFGTGEMLAVGPTKVAPTLGGRSAQGAAVMGGIGAAEPILEKGADVTPGEILKGGVKGAAIGAVAGPILEKAVLPIIGKTIQKTMKFGTAGVKGGLTGLKKSVTRDVTRPFKKIKIKGLAPKKAASLSTKANRFNAKDIEDFQRITKTKANPLGETPGEFATRRGMNKVGDEAVEETTKLWQASMKEADDAMKLIDGNFKVKKGTDYMGEMLDDLSARLGKTLSKDSKKVNLMKKKYDLKGLNMSEINEMKRLYSRNHKYTWLEAGGEAAQRSKNLQDGIRKWQFDTAKTQGFKNLSEINKTTQGWRTFSDNLSKKLKRSSGNDNISLTDWVALSGGEPTNVALFLGKKAGELTPVKRGLIKGLGKQTEPSIIKAKRESILQANLKKRGSRIGNILSDRTSGSSTSLLKKPKPLTLPAGRGEGQRTVIGPSKKPIKLGVSTKTSRPKTTKSKPSKPTVVTKKKALELPLGRGEGFKTTITAGKKPIKLPKDIKKVDEAVRKPFTESKEYKKVDEYLRSKGWTDSAVLYKKIVEYTEKKGIVLDLKKLNTFTLRDLAEKVGYKNSKLSDFNAISGIDSYLAKIKSKKPLQPKK